MESIVRQQLEWARLFREDTWLLERMALLIQIEKQRRDHKRRSVA